MRRLAIRFLIAGLALAFAYPAAARNLALVIGNDAYAHIPHLKKAVNDARAISGTLADLGFIVRRVEDADQRTMSRALATFSGDLQPGDRALFYYSGHGFEIGGTNYLLPTDVPDASANQESLIRDASFPVDRIIDDIRRRGAKVAILVLDACRDNPFAAAGTRGLPGTRGLARVEAPEGVFVLMSAGTKQEALDRLSDGDRNPNSVFTRVFLKELDKPGQTLVELAKHTQVAVRDLAATVGYQQTPAYYDQVIGDVVLANAGPAVAAAGSGDAGADASHVTDNVKTQIITSANTQAGSGVSLGTGVVIGPGVTIGGKAANIAVQNPANPPPDTGRQITVEGNQATAMLSPGPDAGVTRPLARAPIANFMRSNAGWTVSVSLPEPAIAISYRIGDSGAFHDTGLLDTLDQRTGQRMPNPSFQLSGKAQAAIIEVRYQTPDGAVVGPFPIRFDPDVALFDTQRKALEQTWTNWVEFREYNGLLVYFTQLISFRCAITEVRYGLDDADPLRRFDLPPCDPKNPYSVPSTAKIYLKVPEKTKSMKLRVTWRDGTQSDVYSYEK